jgi:hypothetical protein
VLTLTQAVDVARSAGYREIWAGTWLPLEKWKPYAGPVGFRAHFYADDRGAALQEVSDGRFLGVWRLR